MNLTQIELLNLLERVETRVKNNIVRSALKKYLNDDNLINKFNNKLNVYMKSIDDIFSAKSKSSLNELSNNLKYFLEKTDSDPSISVYKIKIHDSITLIVNSVSKYERKGFEGVIILWEEGQRKKTLLVQIFFQKIYFYDLFLMK